MRNTMNVPHIANCQRRTEKKTDVSFMQKKGKWKKKRDYTIANSLIKQLGTSFTKASYTECSQWCSRALKIGAKNFLYHFRTLSLFRFLRNHFVDNIRKATRLHYNSSGFCRLDGRKCMEN